MNGIFIEINVEYHRRVRQGGSLLSQNLLVRCEVILTLKTYIIAAQMQNILRCLVTADSPVGRRFNGEIIYGAQLQ
jgi:hypothetical protein